MSSNQDISADVDSDILNIKGIHMSAKSFRACIFILDELLSCFDCHQFLIPVPWTAVVYHKEITNPMDFRTLEFNLYNDRYKEFHEFIVDLSLIWENAKQFHRSFDPIYKQADNLHKRFEHIVAFLDGGERPFYLSSLMNSVDMVTDTLLPEEKLMEVPFPMYKEVELKKRTNLYFVQALQEQDPLIKKLRGYSSVRLLFQNLNSFFFHYIETNSTNNSILPLPRFYIAKNRTLLQQAREDPDGILAVLCNVNFTHVDGDILQVKSTVVHCEPVDDTHDFDENSLDKSQKYEYSPKAWLKLKIIRVVRDVVSTINSDIDKNFFRRPYNTLKLSTNIAADPKKVGNQELAKEFARSILEPKSISIETKPNDIETNSIHSHVDEGKQIRTRSASFRSISMSHTPPIESRAISPSASITSYTTASRSVSPIKLRASYQPSPGPNESERENSPMIDLPKNIIRISRSKSPNAFCQPEETSKPQKEERLVVPDSPILINAADHPILEDQPTPSQSSGANKTPSVRLIVKSNESTTFEDAPDQVSSEPMDSPLSSEGGTDDETASYEYSDSDLSDGNENDKLTPLSEQVSDHGNQEESSHRDQEESNSTNQEETNSTNQEESNNRDQEESNSGNQESNRSGQEESDSRDQEESNLANKSSSPVTTIEIPDDGTDDRTDDDPYGKSETEESTVIIPPSSVVKEQWRKVLIYAKQRNIPVIDVGKYEEFKTTLPSAEGYFKHVFYAPHDKTKVIQTFKRMSLSQRTTEVVGLVALKNKPRIGQITEILQEGQGGEIIGLCMQRYEKTLKHYTHAHSHHRLSAYQKMDLIIQMLESLSTIHGAGIAHRDLSEVNFMVNTTEETLHDGSQKAELFLIDFGKAVFTNPHEYRRWWVAQPFYTNKRKNSDLVPKTKEELETWCSNLPWIRSKPDHGYKLYRSIQTLPRNRMDTENLAWLINPIAEDLYSIGTLIWKIFAETEPWAGTLDTDLKGLREKIKDDYSIEKSLQREVPGELSRQLLLKFLKVDPLQRDSASNVLNWIKSTNVQMGLIGEWEKSAPVGRQKRHAKALFRFDEEQAQNTTIISRKKKFKSRK